MCCNNWQAWFQIAPNGQTWMQSLIKFNQLFVHWESCFKHSCRRFFYVFIFSLYLALFFTIYSYLCGAVYCSECPKVTVTYLWTYYTISKVSSLEVSPRALAVLFTLPTVWQLRTKLHSKFAALTLTANLHCSFIFN